MCQILHPFNMFIPTLSIPTMSISNSFENIHILGCHQLSCAFYPPRICDCLYDNFMFQQGNTSFQFISCILPLFICCILPLFICCLCLQSKLITCKSIKVNSPNFLNFYQIIFSYFASFQMVFVVVIESEAHKERKYKS